MLLLESAQVAILTLHENRENTYREIAVIVGVSLSTVSRVVNMKMETGLLLQNAKVNVVVREKLLQEMMLTLYRKV